MKFCIFLLLIIYCPLSLANEINFCSKKYSLESEISSNLKICVNKAGVSIIHYDNIYSHKFINHIETQFYIINSLPTGFLCRDGIFTGRYIPPPKYQPKNGIYLYKLENGKYGLKPIVPEVPKKIKIREFIMNYAQLERRKLQALALVVYNGEKNINHGNVYIFPKEKKSFSKFEINNCRVEMTEISKRINKFTMKRR